MTLITGQDAAYADGITPGFTGPVGGYLASPYAYHPWSEPNWDSFPGPKLPIWVAGFSFGARVGLKVGAHSDDVAKLFGIGLALRMFDYRILESCLKPKAIVQASDDEYGPRDEIEAAFRGMSEPKRLWIVDGASHLFPGHLDAFERAAAEAVGWLAALPS